MQPRKHTHSDEEVESLEYTEERSKSRRRLDKDKDENASITPENDFQQETQEDNVFSIKELPPEVLIMIFRFFTLQDLTQAELVCRNFLTLCRDDLIWQPFLASYYPTAIRRPSYYRQVFSENVTRELRTIKSEKINEEKFKAERYLLSLLETNNLKELQARYPSYYHIKKSLHNLYEMHHFNVLKTFFFQLPTRLLLNPNYQRGLDYIYKLVSTAYDEHAVMRHSSETEQGGDLPVPSPGNFQVSLELSPVVQAVLWNQPHETLRSLKEQGFDIDAYAVVRKHLSYYWATPIVFATIMNNPAQVKILLELGARLDVMLNGRENIFHRVYPICTAEVVVYNVANFAAHFNHRELLIYLLKELEDKIDLTQICRSAYLLADVNALACLLECGVTIDFKTLKENNDIEFWLQFILEATANNHISLLKVIKELIDPKADLLDFSIPFQDSSTPYGILNVAAHFRHSELLSCLLEIFQTRVNMQTICWKSFHTADVDALMCFLECGVPIDFKLLKKDDCSETLWMDIVSTAVARNYVLLVRNLLNASIMGLHKHPPKNAGKQTLERYYWLHKAAELGYPKMVALLSEKKAKIEGKDYYGETALQLAIENDHLDVVKVLARKGAKLDDVYAELASTQDTPFKLAVFHGRAAIAQYIYARLARKQQAPQLDEDTRKKLIKEIITQGYTSLIPLFLEKLMPTDNMIDYPGALLIAAVRRGALESVKFFVEVYNKIEFCVIDPVHKMQFSALSYAILCQNEEIVRYLLSKGAIVKPVDWYAAFVFSKNSPPQENPDKMFLLLNEYNKKYKLEAIKSKMMQFEQSRYRGASRVSSSSMFAAPTTVRQKVQLPAQSTSQSQVPSESQPGAGFQPIPLMSTSLASSSSSMFRPQTYHTGQAMQLPAQSTSQSQVSSQSQPQAGLQPITFMSTGLDSSPPGMFRHLTYNKRQEMELRAQSTSQSQVPSQSQSGEFSPNRMMSTGLVSSSSMFGWPADVRQEMQLRAQSTSQSQVLSQTQSGGGYLPKRR